MRTKADDTSDARPVEPDEPDEPDEATRASGPVGAAQETSGDPSPLVPYQHFDVNHVLASAVEGDVFFSPNETMSSGLVNEAAKLARERYLKHTAITRHDVLVSVHGRSGDGYWMTQVADGLALSRSAGKSYVVRAVMATHGAPEYFGDLDYGEALEERQRDYEAGVKAITDQTLPVPLLISQYSHSNDRGTTKIAYEQLAAHVRSKGSVVVIGPTYALPSSSTCLHFTSEGERQLGEYFAKAYSRIVLEGKTWEPLRPQAITMQGNVVTVKFLVPVPPLVLDTRRVSDPGDYGFEVAVDGAPGPAITSVVLDGPDAVRITLASALVGADRRLRYAYTFHGCRGSGTMARGNLRDSDDTPSQSGFDLSNWAVHFDEPIP